MNLTSKGLLKVCISAPGVIVGLACLYLISLGWPYAASTAAWVQAIGSVLAIIAAIWIADRGHQRDRERALLDALIGEAAAARLAECVAHEAASAVLGLGAQWESGLFLGGNISTLRIEQVDNTFRALIQQPVPPRIVSTLFIAIGEVAEAFVDIKRWQLLGAPDDWRDVLQRRASTIYSCRLTFELEYERLASLTGVPFIKRMGV